MILSATHVDQDHGTIVTFATGEGPIIAVDHRIASELNAIIIDQGPTDVEVEAWQIVGQV